MPNSHVVRFAPKAVLTDEAPAMEYRFDCVSASDMLREWEEAVLSSPLPDRPELPTWASGTRKLRQDLLEEEWEEYRIAEAKNDIVGIADALADMMYIIHGTALVYGIDLDAVFAEVHASNMRKLVNGKVLRREDGKILKPTGWEPPNIAKVLRLE